MFSPKMVSVELSLTNHDQKEALTNIHWIQKVIFFWPYIFMVIFIVK